MNKAPQVYLIIEVEYANGLGSAPRIPVHFAVPGKRVFRHLVVSDTRQFSPIDPRIARLLLARDSIVAETTYIPLAWSARYSAVWFSVNSIESGVKPANGVFIIVNAGSKWIRSHGSLRCHRVDLNRLAWSSRRADNRFIVTLLFIFIIFIRQKKSATINHWIYIMLWLNFLSYLCSDKFTNSKCQLISDRAVFSSYI